MTKSRAFIAGFAACYLISAVAFAAAGYRVIACMTRPGAVYYGALWPLSPISVAIDRSLYPIASWACVAPEKSHD
jgi:hypothetical protein